MRGWSSRIDDGSRSGAEGGVNLIGGEEFFVAMRGEMYLIGAASPPIE
jgi:hypothetical protein